jgi:riboflavin kinase/FMN adenylyltransferase
MKLIHTATELAAGDRKVCLAIGFFDGVHLGHQQIIRQTVGDARREDGIGLVITFDRHPNTVVAPHRVPPLIYPLSHKLRFIEDLGADALLLIHFDKPFSEQSGERFVRDVAAGLGRIHSLCVGANFTFGHKRSGDVALLRQLGAALGFAVQGVPAVSLDGKVVSSTRIRQSIRAGEFNPAERMLGRPWSLAGPVARGDRLGRQIGFPTANLDASGLALPPNGVYAAHTELRGKTLRAVVNVGLRPTLQLPAPQVRVEAHLLDFDQELYGEELEIRFLEKLRDEKPFASLDELKAQIARDVEQARLLFERRPDAAPFQ